MLIAVDIGNSLIHIGYFTEKGLFVQTTASQPLLSPVQYRVLIEGFLKEKNISQHAVGSIISSVVPDHTGTFSAVLAKMVSADPVIVDYTTNTGLKFAIPHPETLGADRIANAVAANELYHRPVAAVDLGTATTISVVGKDSEYIGGAIVPGIRLMNESLAKGTSQLTEVPLVPPQSALGIDTAQCIRSGLFYGTTGAVERILSEIEQERGFAIKVVVTGGLGKHISGLLRRQHDFRPSLTLEGLQIIYKRQRNA